MAAKPRTNLYFDRLADALAGLGVTAHAVGWAVKGIWLLGPYLSKPFMDLSNWFYTADGHVRDASAWIETQIDDLKDATGGFSLESALAALITDGWTFVFDAKRWVRRRLAYWVVAAHDFYDYPATWVRDRISTYISNASDFFDSTAYWFSNLAKGVIWDGTNFIDHPALWVRDRAGFYIHNATLFFDWPAKWVKNFVVDMISDGTQFLTFAPRWIRDKITFYIHDATLFFDWPYKWVRNFVVDMIAGGADFLSFAPRWVRDKVSYYIKSADDFFDWPEHWIWDRLRKSPHWFNFELFELDRRIWEWLLDRYDDNFAWFRWHLYRLAEDTIRYFWERKV